MHPYSIIVVYTATEHEVVVARSNEQIRSRISDVRDSGAMLFTAGTKESAERAKNAIEQAITAIGGRLPKNPDMKDLSDRAISLLPNLANKIWADLETVHQLSNAEWADLEYQDDCSFDS